MEGLFNQSRAVAPQSVDDSKRQERPRMCRSTGRESNYRGNRKEHGLQVASEPLQVPAEIATDPVRTTLSPGACCWVSLARSSN